MQQILAIAHYTLLEARRTRLPLLLMAALALMLVLGFFISELAVIENQRMQVSFYAAGARLSGVFIVSAHVLGSITREFDDKGIDALLALDLPRAHYILGKLGGFLAIAALVAAVTSLPLLLQVPPIAVVQWGVAFALELSVMAAFALFGVIALGQFIPAAALVLAFYVLARVLSAIRLMSAHPISDTGSFSQVVGSWMVDALALLMPAFDRWPQTAWLIESQVPWLAWGALLTQALVYVVLLSAAAMFDFQRRNF